MNMSQMIQIRIYPEQVKPIERLLSQRGHSITIHEQDYVTEIAALCEPDGGEKRYRLACEMVAHLAALDMERQNRLRKARRRA